MKKNWIVLTTINHPTKAVFEFARIARNRNWGMVVVGDTKTPADWRVDGVDFLSIEKQDELFPELSRMLPKKHYARKNLGYLYAMMHGASVIIESDDDNQPYESFGKNVEIEVCGHLISGAPWANKHFSNHDVLIWPRGLPLDAIHEIGIRSELRSKKCPIKQFLADVDPDVDAIYRLLHKKPFHFEKLKPDIILGDYTYCPFNSQNTVIHHEAFELLYLPAYVSFRMTDIWRSFVAQRILWARGMSVSFHGPTVFQIRNIHNLMKDFDDEVVGYLRNTEIAAVLNRTDIVGLSISESLSKCYAALRVINIITEEELLLLEQWIKTLKSFQK